MDERLQDSVEREPKHYGLTMEDFTPEVWSDIVRYYYEISYPNDPLEDHKVDINRVISDFSVERIRERLARTNAIDMRLGASFSEYKSDHPKLVVWDETRYISGLKTARVRFAFNINEPDYGYEDPTTANGQEALAMKLKFDTGVQQYLESKGIAVPIY